MAEQNVNLGQVAGLHIGTTAPDNIKLIWWDSNSSQNCHKIYDSALGSWTILNQGIISVITYSEIVNLATGSGLPIGKFYKLTLLDSAVVLALAITETKVQYTDALGNFVIDDLGTNIQYHVTSSNLYIDGQQGVFNAETKQLLFSFEEKSFDFENDYLLGKTKVLGAYILSKFRFKNIISSITGNSIVWNNGLHFNFKAALDAWTDREGGVVSTGAYDLTIEEINASFTGLADNFNDLVNSTNEVITNATTSTAILGKVVPALNVSGSPVDVSAGDTFLVVFSKFQTWINKIKKADGVSVTTNFTPSSALNDINNNDSVDSGLRKLQAWINSFKRADGILVKNDFTPSTSPVPIANTDSVDAALRKLNGYINLLGAGAVPIGVCVPSFRADIPANFMKPMGQALNISDYPECYAALGGVNSIYGQNLAAIPATFNLPNVPAWNSLIQNDETTLRAVDVITGGVGYHLHDIIALVNGATVLVSSVTNDGGAITGAQLLTPGTATTNEAILADSGSLGAATIKATFKALTFTNGQTGGEKTHLLTSYESGMPAHTPNADVYDPNPDPGMEHFGSGLGDPAHYNGQAPLNEVPAQNAAAAHNNMPPYVMSNYIIRVK